MFYKSSALSDKRIYYWDENDFCMIEILGLI